MYYFRTGQVLSQQTAIAQLLVTSACHTMLQARSLQNDLFIDLHIVAIISTRAMYLYNQKGCDMETWQTDMAMGVSKTLHHLKIITGTCLQESDAVQKCDILDHLLQPDVLVRTFSTTNLSSLQGVPPDLDAFTDFFKGFSKCHKIVIDCTANTSVPSYYARWLSTGIHVITANKKLCSGPLDEWTKVRNTYREHGTHFMYEVCHTPHALPCQCWTHNMHRDIITICLQHACQRIHLFIVLICHGHAHDCSCSARLSAASKHIMPRSVA